MTRARKRAEHTSADRSRWLRLLPSLSALVLSIACSSSEPPVTGTARLIGTWELSPDADESKGLVAKPRIIFGEDGSLVMVIPAPAQPISEASVPPVRDAFEWKLDTDRDGVMTLNITHPVDGRSETMAIRMLKPDELRVEGKAPATFRRVN